FATSAVAAAQSGGRIAGRVTTADGRPLPGIQLTVTGTALGAVSDTGGRFLIREVPAGNRSVLARGIGYTSDTKPVTVSAGQTVSVDFTLTSSPIQLSPIVT